MPAPNSPVISVIIPAHNAERTLQRAVQSVQLQTIPVHEILIYDDSSIDRTASMIEQLGKMDPRIKGFGSDTNKGAGHARDFLLKRSIGDFAAFLDADDAWHPTKLERQIPKFNDPKVGICGCSFNVHSQNGRTSERSIPRRFGRKLMHASNYIGMSTAIVRLELNGSREMPKIRKRQDYAYWLSILRLNPGILVSGVDEPLVDYHQQAVSLSSNKLDNVRWNYAVFRQTQEYPAIISGILTLGNIAFRLFR